jgi:hypothetical protein
MTSTLLRSSALLIALLMATSPAFAKKKPIDLSAFTGSYSGTLSATEDSTSVTGNVMLSLTSTKKGETALLIYRGSFTGDFGTVPVSASITLNKSGTSSVSNVQLGLGDMTLPGTGTAHFSRSKFNFTASTVISGDTYKLSGKGTVKDAGKKRKLILTFQMNIPSEAISFNNKLTARIPKKKVRAASGRKSPTEACFFRQKAAANPV